MSHNTQMIEEYEVNPNTMIIKPLAYGLKVYSQIWELDDEVTSPFKPIDIIKSSCKYFGSSYEGLLVMEELKNRLIHKSLF
ncbi:hypothetical protein HMPREF1013_00878 [Bacillus sp. 2_A_57_CT2]|nr:hypothetical protein HMPREF1013_00878 [Bacillus sp. 2_A_57_CT2]